MHRPRQHNVNSLNGILVVSIGLLIIPGIRSLVYPSGTSLQLTSSMSVPIDLDNRKVFMDMGFQMNYVLPINASSFYDPVIWPNAFERRGKRELDKVESGIHPRDFTAGELYAGVERLLEEHGFHRSCLLLSVCELALHPFANNHSYMFEQIINFLLTPSQHDGFGSHEKLYQHRYERAEKLGFIGGDCQKAYPKCQLDVLNIVTTLIR